MSSEMIDNYNVIQSIAKNQYCNVLRAFDIVTKNSCILKTTYTSQVDTLAYQTLKREYDILQDLHHKGIARPIRFIEKNGQSILVIEDHKEITLEDFLKIAPIEVEDFYIIAIQLCDIIGYIHSCHIIQKDINLENILINPTSLKIRFIDFSIATKLSQNITQLIHPNLLEANIHYVSPEQTGRMNRSYDYRTDFYALGVCFFKLLTREFPFSSQDRVNLIYAHMTEKPKNISQINNNIPLALAEIVAKCLEKSPENRYQSAYGLKNDLMISKKYYQEKNFHKLFALGKKDTPSHFQLSEKVYGREHEIESLLQSFEHAKKHPFSLVTISGQSGVGKTLLVHELYKPLTEKNSIFITGKFDQYQASMPYLAWVQALENLVNYIFSLQKEEFEVIKEKINEAVYPNGQVILNFIPTLEKIIGKQPRITVGTPEQEQNRFYYVFYRFLNLFCDGDRPLVIYLDDWQWADQPSIQLLEVLMLQYQPMNVLCIVSYRDNEIDDNHPFSYLLNKLKKENSILKEISLKDLKLDHVKAMLSDSLFEDDSKNVLPLANMIYKKTNGNPFFVVQYLKTMYNQQFLYFDNTKGKWIWDLVNAEKLVSNDFVGFMLHNFSTLDPSTQRVLQLAACIGNNFDLGLLSKIANKNVVDLLKILFPALQRGFITVIDMNDTTGELNTGTNRYKFSHDRLQQTAYEMIPIAEKIELHYKIATILCRGIKKKKLPKRIFNIVNHLLKAESKFTNSKDRWKLFKINYVAGKIAMKAIAFKPALKYFDAALRNLGKDQWQKHYNITFNLYKNICECAYINHDFTLTSRIAKEALKNIKFKHEKFYIYGIIVSALNAQSKPLEAIDTTWEVIKEAGINLPYQTGLPALSLVIARMYWHLWGNNYETLIKKPLSNDLVHCAAIDLLTRSLAPFYAVRDPYIIVYTGCRVFIEILTKGFTPTAPLVVVAFSIIFCMFRDFKRAMMLAKVALHLLPEGKDKWKYAFTKTVYVAFIMPWNFPFDNCVEELKKTHQIALNTGHLEAAALSNYWEINCLRFKGIPLLHLKDKIEKYYLENVKLGQFFISNAFQIQLQALENLSNHTNNPWDLTGIYLNAKSAMKNYKINKDIGMIKHFYYNSFLVSVLLGKFKIAYRFILRGNLIREEREPGSFENAYCNSLIVVTLAHFYPRVRFKNKIKILKNMMYFTMALKAQRKQNPTNFEHLYFLAKASVAAMHNRYQKAEMYYKMAKSQALKNNFPLEYARTTELLADFYLKNNNPELSFLEYAEAIKCFEELGYVTKIYQVMHDRADFLSQHYSLIMPKTKITHQLIAPLTEVDSGNEFNMDIVTLTKVSQALSNEIILSNLIEKAMYYINENIGADRCVLLLNKDQQLFVEGSLKKNEKPENILHSINLESYDLVPLSIINFVFRSGESLTLSKIENDPRFNEDVYFTNHVAASILCTPIIHQKQIVGILYFENRDTSQIFRKEAIDTVKLLSPQIAISIQNAILYSAFKRFVPVDFLNLLGKSSLLNIQKGDCVGLQLSILFLDVRNFTSLSESLNPKEVFEILNDFFGFITPIINENHGFVDKYVGDAVMAIFPKQADDAVSAGIALRQAIDKFNQSRKYLNPINVGIGIHTGFTILGTIGDDNRLDGSVVSDAVNTASRVEELNKRYHVKLIITKETYENLNDKNNYVVRMLDVVNVKGKEKVIHLFQVINAESEDVRRLLRNILPDFEQGWYFYQKKEFEKAIACFKKCLVIYPDDEVSKTLLHRSEDFIKHSQ